MSNLPPRSSSCATRHHGWWITGFIPHILTIQATIITPTRGRLFLSDIEEVIMAAVIERATLVLLIAAVDISASP